MAVGFGNVDNFQETIQATIDNGIDFARSQLYSGESEEYCLDCSVQIPEKRRTIMKGCQYCVNCQSKHEKSMPSLINRRGNKDSQIR